MFVSEQFIEELTDIEKKVLLRKTALVATKWTGKLLTMRKLVFLGTVLKALGKSLKAVSGRQKELDDKIMKKIKQKEEERIERKIIKVTKELYKERNKLKKLLKS
jgi:hypothetical protein